MKETYYYTVASLPSLFFTDPPPLSSEDFLSKCEIELSPSEYYIINSASLLPEHLQKPISWVLKRWYEWEQNIRNELVKLRAKKMGKDASPYIRSESSEHSAEVLAREVFNADSPLNAQDMLDHARWEYLEELEWGHYFDREKLIIYYLKLQILEGRSRFNKEEGQKRLGEILKQVNEKLP